MCYLVCVVVFAAASNGTVILGSLIIEEIVNCDLVDGGATFPASRLAY